MNKIQVFLLLFVAILFSCGASALSYDDLPYTGPGEYNTTPDGKYVYINDENVFIMAPAEIHGTGWTYLNFTAKQYTGDIDLAVGFDTDHLKPKKAEFYKPHYVNWTTYHEHTIYNVTGEYYLRTTEPLDYGNEYNTNYQFVVNYSKPNYNYSECDPYLGDCVPDNYTTESIVVAFDSILPLVPPVTPGMNYTIYWHTNYSRIDNWLDITDRFSVLPESIHNNYDGKDKWYYVKDQPITTGQEYQIRIFVEAPPQLGINSYKYDVVIKPSNQDFATAKANGNLYILDPYWNTSFSNRDPITITTTGTSTPAWYQVLLNVSYQSEMQNDFDDIRFTNSSNGELSYWIESKVNGSYANVWVNLSDAITDPGSDTIWMYYGNAGLSDGGNIADTFVFGDDFNRADGTDIGEKWAEYGDGGYQIKDNTMYRPDITAGTNYDLALAKVSGELLSVTDTIVESKIKVTAITTVNVENIGITARANEEITVAHRGYGLIVHAAITTLQIIDCQVAFNNSATISQDFNEWWNWKLQVNGNNIKGKAWQVGTYEGGSWDVEDTSTTVASGYVGLHAYYYGTTEQYYDDFRVRKYIANEPTPSYGPAQFYIDSLHYNATTPYNHTIESDGTITANRSIVTVDDTNDTAQSTGTSYITINVYDNGASIVRNFTVEGDILDWYQAANLSGEYTLNNGSGILDTQSDVGGLVNFTIDLSAGDYTISQKYKDEEIQFYFI